MRQSTDWAKERFAEARVARLGTVSAGGRPRVVPIVFALLGDTLVTGVDGKPKSSAHLQRIENIASNPKVSVLVDHYDDDWTQLWWARADGDARVIDEDAGVRAALVARYDQYREFALPGPFIVIEVAGWSGWSAV
jgi:PPOX class probable F420-dependent enzyme